MKLKVFPHFGTFYIMKIVSYRTYYIYQNQYSYKNDKGCPHIYLEYFFRNFYIFKEKIYMMPPIIKYIHILYITKKENKTIPYL